MAIFVGAANAQTISGEELRERYLQRYEELDHYIKQMSNPRNSIEKRQEYMSLALNLFYAKGESYMEGSVTMPAPKIVIESNRRKVSMTVKSFFCKLVNGMYKGSFAITDIPIPQFPTEIDASSLLQVNDSIFTLETSVSQQFSGYKDGQMAYEDVTAKKIKVHLLKKNVSSKDVFAPFLTGDIHAVMKQSL